MKRCIAKQLVICLIVQITSLAAAQTPPAAGESILPVQFERLEPDRINRFSLAYRMGFNITADFKKLGGFGALTDIGPLLGGQENRTYDDGYNQIDSNGNNHGPGFENTTWFWGYSDPAAIQGGSILMNSSSSPADVVSKNKEDGLKHGFEMTYQRELYRTAKGYRFGFEAAFGYTLLSIDDHRTLNGSVTQVTDSYELPAGFVAPPPGYTGTFNGPGAVIGSTPLNRVTNVVTTTASVEGTRKLDANIFSLRLGPYAEIPLNDRFSILVSGGISLIGGDTHFSFNEIVTISGLPPQTRRGSGSQFDFLVGGYASANLQFALTKDINLFTGVQYQTAGRSVNKTNGKEAILNMGQSLMVVVGASYKF